MSRFRLLLLFSLLTAVVLWRPWRLDQWLTPDQQADRLFRAGRKAAAASLYQDPLREGVAWYRAGDFKQAERAFARDSTAAGAYDRGNALVMLGKYDEAIQAYDRALQLQPGWSAAADNRDLARRRWDRIANAANAEEGTGGEMKPDAMVFDQHPPRMGQETVQMTGGSPLTDEQLRTLWLRRVQTRPADFLKARFAWQLHQESHP